MNLLNYEAIYLGTISSTRVMRNEYSMIFQSKQSYMCDYKRLVRKHCFCDLFGFEDDHVYVYRVYGSLAS